MHTAETRMAAECFDGIFGTPVYHNPALRGDLSSLANWWSNMFTGQFYQAHEPLFRRGAHENLAQLVARLTGGRLEPQFVDRPHLEMGGLNERGKIMRILQKSVSRPSTINQRMENPGRAC